MRMHDDAVEAFFFFVLLVVAVVVVIEEEEDDDDERDFLLWGMGIIVFNVVLLSFGRLFGCVDSLNDDDGADAAAN